MFQQSLNCLLSLFVCFIFQTCTSSRSSLASGSLIGSTLKARMEPSSQVPCSCLCSGTDLVATDKRLGRILQVVLQVNISVSRPGAAHRPSEQPSLPARPTSNGLPVAVAQQPVNKVPAQVAVQVVRGVRRWSHRRRRPQQTTGRPGPHTHGYAPRQPAP